MHLRSNGAMSRSISGTISRPIRYAILLLILGLCLCLAACSSGGTSESGSASEASVASDQAGTYTQISQDEAMEMMEKDDGHVIVDVRTQEEYDEGHIPDAVLIPNETIADSPPAELPDKDQIILIYCRRGNRSKDASQKLADMGYTNIYEFGGIETWEGEVVTE